MPNINMNVEIDTDEFVCQLDPRESAVLLEEMSTCMDLEAALPKIDEDSWENISLMAADILAFRYKKDPEDIIKWLNENLVGEPRSGESE